jgi:hypothetical protein
MNKSEMETYVSATPFVPALFKGRQATAVREREAQKAIVA